MQVLIKYENKKPYCINNPNLKLKYRKEKKKNYTKNKTKKNYNKYVIYMTLQCEIDSDRTNDIS
jgi:hypothetical protein